MRLGIVMLGQSPRPDIQTDFAPMLYDTEIVQFGVLDDCSQAEVSGFTPQQGSFVLTRLRDGNAVKVGVPEVSHHMQNMIGSLEKDMQALLIFSTQPVKVASRKPILRPSAFLASYLPSVMQRGHLTVIRGTSELTRDAESYWSARLPGCRISSLTATPFTADWQTEWTEVTSELRRLSPQAVLLDGLGYSRPMQQYLKKSWGGPVLLPRALLGRVLTNFF